MAAVGGQFKPPGITGLQPQAGHDATNFVTPNRKAFFAQGIAQTAGTVHFSMPVKDQPGLVFKEALLLHLQGLDIMGLLPGIVSAGADLEHAA